MHLDDAALERLPQGIEYRRGEFSPFVEEQDEQGGVNVEFNTVEEAVEKWNTRFDGDQ